MTRRNIDRYDEFDISLFRSLDSFYSRIAPPGVITIEYNDLPLDILNVHRGSTSTLIVFHSSLSAKMQELPVFSGQSLASDLDMNLISISDPSLVMNDELNLTWFLGNRQQPLMDELPLVIRHILASHAGSQPIYFGASGGGFAALLYSREHVGAVTIVANPRIDLTAPPRQDVGAYLRHCFGVVGRTPAQRVMRNDLVMRLQDLYASSNHNKVLYVQNFRDGHYLRGSALPFIERMSENPLLNVCLADFGLGHRPIPGDFLRDIIRSVIQEKDATESGLIDLGFKTAPSLLEVHAWIDELLGKEIAS